MARLESEELLERLLMGDEITSAELDELIENAKKIKEANGEPEDLHLDFKHGDVLDDKKKASRMMREYISGFANSAGGTLIIGIDEENWEVIGCSPPGGGDPATWASDCLTELVFSTIPRFHVIDHTKGKVLVVAVGRSLRLVPVREGQDLVYYFRFYHQTLKAPPYLVSDLMLGRRQGPMVKVNNISITGTKIQYNMKEEWVRYHIDIFLENEGLSWADDVTVGVVCLGTSTRPDSMNSMIRQSIDIATSDIFPEINIKTVGGAQTMPPLSICQMSIRFETIPSSQILKQALFVYARNMAPIWYQLTVVLSRLENKMNLHHYSLNRMWNERSKVEVIMQR